MRLDATSSADSAELSALTTPARTHTPSHCLTPNRSDFCTQQAGMIAQYDVIDGKSHRMGLLVYFEYFQETRTSQFRTLLVDLQYSQDGRNRMERILEAKVENFIPHGFRVMEEEVYGSDPL